MVSISSGTELASLNIIQALQKFAGGSVQGARTRLASCRYSQTVTVWQSCSPLNISTQAFSTDWSSMWPTPGPSAYMAKFSPSLLTALHWSPCVQVWPPISLLTRVVRCTAPVGPLVYSTDLPPCASIKHAECVFYSSGTTTTNPSMVVTTGMYRYQPVQL